VPSHLEQLTLTKPASGRVTSRSLTAARVATHRQVGFIFGRNLNHSAYSTVTQKQGPLQQRLYRLVSAIPVRSLKSRPWGRVSRGGRIATKQVIWDTRPLFG
jgi:hypothetical protein